MGGKRHGEVTGEPITVPEHLDHHRFRKDGDNRPSSRARLTASARLCTPSFAYTLRRCVRIVFSDTNSYDAISGARRLVGK